MIKGQQLPTTDKEVKEEEMILGMPAETVKFLSPGMLIADKLGLFKDGGSVEAKEASNARDVAADRSMRKTRRGMPTMQDAIDQDGSYDGKQRKGFSSGGGVRGCGLAQRGLTKGTMR